jgi:hypothetical protein
MKFSFVLGFIIGAFTLLAGQAVAKSYDVKVPSINMGAAH